MNPTRPFDIDFQRDLGLGPREAGVLGALVDILDPEKFGLMDLAGCLQAKGFPDLLTAWTNQPEDQAVFAAALEECLGPGHLNEIARRTGLKRPEIVSILTATVPDLIQWMIERKAPIRDTLEQGLEELGR